MITTLTAFVAAILVWIKDQDAWVQATLTGVIAGLVVFVLVTVLAFIAGKLGKKSSSKNEPGLAEIPLPQIQQAELEKSGFEFYPDRDALNQRRGSIRQEFQSTEEVWVAWSSGAVVENEGGILDDPKLRKLLLIDPDSEYLDYHAGPFGVAKDRIQQQINWALDQAHKSNDKQPRKASQSPIKIKTYSGPMTDTLVIGNPHWAETTGKEADTWIRLETSVPYKFQAKRPSFLITKEREPGLYMALYQHYLDMWNDENLSSSYPKPLTKQSVPDTPNSQP